MEFRKTNQPKQSPGIRLFHPALKRERGLLRAPGADMLRLRCNPFSEYLQERALQFTGFSGKGED
jgi:hypothetical protein